MRSGHASDARSIGDVGKPAMTVVLIKGIPLVCEISDYQIGQTVIVIVSEIHTHAGIGGPIVINTNVCREADFFKCPVAPIVIKKFGYGIVGHEHVDMPSAVVISNR